MYNKARKLGISSVVINRDFLKKLGIIVEKQLDLRKKAYVDSSLEFNQEKLKKHHPGEILLMPTPPHYKLNYTLIAKKDKIIDRDEYPSMQDLLSAFILPEKIIGLYVKIEHYDPQYVDISIKFDSFSLWCGDVILSSESENDLYLIENELKSLFKEFRTSYNWILFSSLPEYSLFYVLSFIAGGANFFLLFLKLLMPNIDRDILHGSIIASLIILSTLIVYFGITALLKYLFPFYSFELSNRKKINTGIRALITTIILGIIISLIAGVILSL